MELNINLCRKLISDKFKNPEVRKITKISDGLAKLTYKIIVNRTPCILQIWKEPKSKFDDLDSAEQEFIYSNSTENLILAHDLLMAEKINSPKIILHDNSREKIAWDYVLFEYISGIPLFQKLSHDYENLLLLELAEIFGKINKNSRNFSGKINEKNVSQDLVDISKQYCFQELDNAVRYNPKLKTNKSMIEEKLNDISKSITTRDNFNLIHGDINPNHFIVNDCDEIYVIDYDGMKYFDIEFEIAQFYVPNSNPLNSKDFLNRYYETINIEIDENRLEFYKLFHSITGISYFSEKREKFEKRTEDIELLSKFEEAIGLW